MVLKKKKAGVKRKASDGVAAVGDKANGASVDEPLKTASKKNRHRGSKMDAPDAAEVLEIAQTQNLFKSNLFRMQLAELLKTLAPRAAYPRLESFLRSLQPLLLALTPREISSDFAGEFPSLSFHLRNPHPFSFKPPARVDVVGSFLLSTFLRAHPVVDLALEIPSDTLASKDYLNFRYTDKRAAYVGEVFQQLSALAKADGPLRGVGLEIGHLRGDPYRPCILLRMGELAEGGHWIVRLLPNYALGLWKPQLLAADRNALRPAGLASDGEQMTLPPTPCYNASILEDCCMRSHLAALHDVNKRLPIVKDATLLVKRWAIGRSVLGSGAANAGMAFDSFCLAALVAHAGIASSLAPTSTSPFQLFKLALSTIVTTEWASHKLIFGKSTPASLSDEEVRAGGAHFYMSDSPLNIFCRIAPFLSEFQREAKRALQILDTCSDPYDAIFGESASPELIYDVIVRTPQLNWDSLAPCLKDDAALAALPGLVEAGVAPPPADYPYALTLAAQLPALLSLGLSDRCVSVGVRFLGLSASGRKYKAEAGPSILVGLSLDASALERTVDRGPPAQDVAAAARFRALWGQDKAELRRFKDGSILECAVWQKPPAERLVESRKQPAVVTQIIRHLLQRHFPNLAVGAIILGGPVGLVSNLRDADRRLWMAFDGFRTHLCQLSSLPLTIKDVHPESSAFSYSEIIPVVAPAASDGIPRTLHSVVVEFESSGRWPDDPEAARKVCAALLLQMKEELQTDLGIESGVTEEYLDIRYPEFTFRVRILHQHELLATAHRVTNFQAQLKGLPLDLDAVERLRRLWWRPRFRLSMHGHALQRPAMAGTARLVKRWFASQMLSGYDDFVEHLVASVFLQPLPFEAPTSPQVALCRVFWLLGNYDWAREALVVDFDGKLTDEERLAMRRSFEAGHGDATSRGTFWLSSRYDPHYILLRTPPLTVSIWLQRRARQSLQTCQDAALGFTERTVEECWRGLFSVDSSLFDVVLRLNPPRAPVSTVKATQRRREAAVAATLRLVERLRATLISICLVFYDETNLVVALKWRPGAFLPQPQHVLMGAVPHTMVPPPGGSEGPPLCVPNVPCILSMIQAMAEGLSVSVNMAAAT